MRIAAVALAVFLGWPSAAASACGGLVAPNGTVRLLRTATLAAYADGVEHYVTSFQFAGGGAEFGSIVPLPAVPTKVERGGDWTLQRLDRETQPPADSFVAGTAAGNAGSAMVVYETRIDALDITILKGGAREVGTWAKDNGFQLTPDAPEVLEFYAFRSPVFMAARFDAKAAEERGQQVGDGTPIHLTIPTRNPWVPLRILGLGRGTDEPVDADVYLLTPMRPALLPLGRKGVDVVHDAEATSALLADLRSDKGMEWVPQKMWLTKVAVRTQAETLRFDLAADASGRNRPSHLAAGLPRPKQPATTTTTTTVATTTTTTAVVLTDSVPEAAVDSEVASSSPPWGALLVPALLTAVVAVLALRSRRRRVA
ncbi:MAG TPA: DUF2330 domain-containing protein [Acidimicrobiales bacterium]|nr:DUF2330 domain-containing protein [Acidimicrobiales bacterium]